MKKGLLGIIGGAILLPGIASASLTFSGNLETKALNVRNPAGATDDNHMNSVSGGIDSLTISPTTRVTQQPGVDFTFLAKTNNAAGSFTVNLINSDPTITEYIVDIRNIETTSSGGTSVSVTGSGGGMFTLVDGTSNTLKFSSAGSTTTLTFSFTGATALDQVVFGGITVQAIPEPSTSLPLMALLGIPLILARRRKGKSTTPASLSA